ncbi:acetyltransferase (GNAT) family protein [Acidipila rosea]|uniref:Acetyltransferase (GNAT) family protein n=1 Tax=Acidipila rosea TaxID=768535 RepID=A0A4R1L6T9_9BACT|nr:acetyltransferase (GNAT) family protein [Acidipila rosea]
MLMGPRAVQPRVATTEKVRLKDEFRLRRCGAGDEQALSLVGAATFLEAFAGTLEGRDILLHCQKQHAPEVYATWMAETSSRIYIAESSQGGAPVGYAVLAEAKLPVADPQLTDIELKRIYLLHRFQGCGLGRALMEQSIEAAREMGRKRLLLGVYGRNVGAIAFYERCGFRKVGERTFLVGTTLHEDAVMGREI